MVLGYNVCIIEILSPQSVLNIPEYFDLHLKKLYSFAWVSHRCLVGFRWGFLAGPLQDLHGVVPPAHLYVKAICLEFLSCWKVSIQSFRCSQVSVTKEKLLTGWPTFWNILTSFLRLSWRGHLDLWPIFRDYSMWSRCGKAPNFFNLSLTNFQCSRTLILSDVWSSKNRFLSPKSSLFHRWTPVRVKCHNICVSTLL